MGDKTREDLMNDVEYALETLSTLRNLINTAASLDQEPRDAAAFFTE